MNNHTYSPNIFPAKAGIRLGVSRKITAVAVKTMYRFLGAVTILLLTLPQITVAQEEAAADTTLQKRIELAREMHKINPTRDQVHSALERVAATKPASQRRDFIIKMNEILHYKAIEKVSIDAMVELYTLEELEAMVAFHGSDIGKSIKEKHPQWTAKLAPEIIRMMDVAYMRLRTGDAP